MTRRLLPKRRPSIGFDVSFLGRKIPVMVGFYEDWTIGEVFIGFHKFGGSDGDVAARNEAVLISIALQYGAPLETLAAAAMKTHAGKPDGLAAVVLAELVTIEAQMRASNPDAAASPNSGQ